MTLDKVPTSLSFVYVFAIRVILNSMQLGNKKFKDLCQKEDIHTKSIILDTTEIFIGYSLMSGFYRLSV